MEVVMIGFLKMFKMHLFRVDLIGTPVEFETWC